VPEFLKESRLDGPTFIQHRAWRGNEQAAAALRARIDPLTPRERVVMALVVTCLLNKQIAGDLGISEVAVKHVVAKT
jgi:FixJ family two-component response regulator